MPETVLKTEYKVNNKKSFLIPKRIFDLVVSFAALVVLLLPMTIVALVIRLESPGPVIYKQERLGRNGKVFMMYKFRSMRKDAEKDGSQWASVGDPRCTKVGKILRLWHIDELPQLWNVVLGDMSIVGPRPERACFYDEFEKEIPGFRNRLLVDQGLTGVAQVNGGYDLTPAGKLEYDLQYIQTQSLWTDFKCIIKTFAVLVSHEGAR